MPSSNKHFILVKCDTGHVDDALKKIKGYGGISEIYQVGSRVKGFIRPFDIMVISDLPVIRDPWSDYKIWRAIGIGKLYQEIEDTEHVREVTGLLMNYTPILPGIA